MSANRTSPVRNRSRGDRNSVIFTLFGHVTLHHIASPNANLLYVTVLYRAKRNWTKTVLPSLKTVKQKKVKPNSRGEFGAGFGLFRTLFCTTLYTIFSRYGFTDENLKLVHNLVQNVAQ
jgi:hypothetical protein